MIRWAAILGMLAGCGAAVPVPVLGAAPAAPTGIEARVVDRRATSMEVCWRAPAPDDEHSAAVSFEVRYARVPITEAIFDDRKMAVRVPFTGARRAFAAGERVCQVITGLYIETGYYFAVGAVSGDAPAPSAKEPTS